MLIQLQYQAPDGSKKLIAQKDSERATSDLFKWFMEAKKHHPLPEGHEWFFVYSKDALESTEEFIMATVGA